MQILKSLCEKFVEKSPQGKSLRIKLLAFVAGFIVAVSIGFYCMPPKNFPINTVTTIREGDSLQEISNRLKKDGIIKSVFMLRTVTILLGGERKIIAGDYLLDKKENSISLAYRFITGSFHLEMVKITIPEGWNVSEIAGLLDGKLKNVNKADFVALAQKEEGYLFPDTYFISPVKDSQGVIDIMKENFDRKIALIQKQISDSGHSQSDIIKMASILEGEAMPNDRPTVAGILWKRLAMGMPLQVDSSIKFLTGKESSQLTLADLKIDSPYNLYINLGLPPTPIDNPGIQAIMSAMAPVESDYLYFLTEKDGTIHYAKTFAEHVANKAKYLK